MRNLRECPLLETFLSSIQMLLLEKSGSHLAPNCTDSKEACIHLSSFDSFCTFIRLFLVIFSRPLELY
jgi:hypothetical protein